MMIIIVVIEPTPVLKPQRGEMCIEHRISPVLKPQRGEMSVENTTSPNRKPQRGEMCIAFGKPPR